jgi:hypothetical protein
MKSSLIKPKTAQKSNFTSPGCYATLQPAYGKEIIDFIAARFAADRVRLDQHHEPHFARIATDYQWVLHD